jgi:hypothetical protein
MMAESMAPVLAPGMQVSLGPATLCSDGQHLILGKDGNAAINLVELDRDSHGDQFFTVVNAGNNLVALHNAKHNRFLRLFNGKVDSCSMDIDKLPMEYHCERFS